MTFRTGATFSDDMKYRYRLWRHWDDSLRAVLFVLLNPSTANEFDDDPTVTRCIQRAKNLGFGGVEVCNVFGYRATDPQELYEQEDPFGEDNQSELAAATALTGMTVCGWGTNAEKVAPGIQAIVRNSLGPTYLNPEPGGASLNVAALGFNNDGSPKHPLYLGYDEKPVPYPLIDD